tara:strand:+ start:164 stop:1861 length:1698 start_codon:yes stop_codon:yes gene_type:complete
MRQHKFEVGDKVFILLRDSDLDEDSGFVGTMRNSIGEVTHIKNVDNTPLIYKVEISGEMFFLHEKQMALISDSDSFRDRQLVTFRTADSVHYAVIVKKYTDDRIRMVSHRSGFRDSKLSVLIDLSIRPLTFLELENMESLDIRYFLKKIAEKQGFNRHGWQEECEFCRDWVGEYDSYHISGEGYLCLDCYEEYTYECTLCEKEFYITDRSMKSLKGDKVCQHCFDIKVFTCASCGVSYANEKFFEYDSYRYCGKCFNLKAISVMSSPPRMLSRSLINKISLGSGKEYIANRSKTAVAIEIEAVDVNYDVESGEGREYDYPSGWKDTYDGSIGGESGREFIMEPEFGDDALKKISIFCSWLRDEEFFVDNTCGLHVHTDAYYMGIEQLKGILLVSRALEPFIYKMIPKHRMESRYSKPMDEIDSKIILEVKNARDFCDLWYYRMNNTQATTEKYNDSRYRGLNLHSRFLHGTIEYRYHHGTISDYYINNWILFCLSISDYGSQFLSLEKKSVLDLFINKESKDFSDYLTAMGVSNLIPYVNEMIEGNSPEINNNDKETIWTYSSHL